MKRMKFHIRFMLAVLCIASLFQSVNAQNKDGLELYTPYTKISVSPGKSVSYSVDLINNGSQTSNEFISVSNIPRSWNYTLTAGGYDVDKLAVLSGQKKTLTLKVDVPYQVRKGNYTFYIKAGDVVKLPVTINVSTGGSNESELTCDQKNMEGTSKSSFNFKAVLKNRTMSKQQYALMAEAPRGWSVAIKPAYQQATSTEVEANGTKDITYEIKAPASVKAGTYKIPVKAVSGSTSAGTELEVVITGTYEIDLNTPTGLLSAKITAGGEKKVELNVFNSGSAILKNVTLSAGKPKNWEVTFDPKKIEDLEPGKTETVYATIKADKKAIPGDYVSNITAKTPEASSSVSFRIMVKTPILMGWLGILIIIGAIGGVAFLFKKYGRR
ncbi:COG1470 family protein [Sunxiuqinia sp. A32]|uniref:COG1470 family protein n=1 Tax=Sunxiuqinia sp. A32 TaxID=3461496 RepID=UPI004045E5AE